MATARHCARADPDLSMNEQPAPRLSARAFLGEVADELFSLDRGVPYTVAQLLVRPGQAIRRYIVWRDTRLTRPFRLALIVLALVATLLHLVGFSEGLSEGMLSAVDAGDPGAAPLHATIASFTDHFDLLLVLAWVPGIAAGVQSMYQRHALNYAEVFVFGLFTLAQMLIWLLPALLLLAASVAVPGWVVPLLAMTPVIRSAHGYFQAEREPAWRALLCAVFGAFSMAVLMLGILMGMLLWNHAFG